MFGRSLALVALLALPAHALLSETADLRFDAALGGVAVPGGFTTVDVQFVNYGPSPAGDLKVTIGIPNGATYDGSYYASDMKCAGPPAGSTGTLTCTTPSLGVSPFIGAHYVSSFVDFNPRIDPATPPGTVLAFPVTMTSSNALQPSQSATAMLRVVTPADLTIAVKSPAQVTAGDALVSTITVTNHGPADGMSVEVYVASSPAHPQQMSGPGWSCWASGCFTNTFPPGTATFVLTSLVPGTLQDPEVTQRFEVSSINELDYRDNTISVTTAVNPAPPPSRRRAVHH